MLKFLPGIILLQVITVALVMLAPSGLAGWEWLRLGIPLVIVGLLTAFWFGAVAAHQRKDEISRLQECHAKEREAIRVNAERAKHKVLKQAQQETLQEVRRTSTQANIKVGLALAGMAGIGGLLLLTQFMTLGLLTLTTAGGALGGYVLRLRQEKTKPALPDATPDHPRLINATPVKSK
ncbi:MAG TPA: hypothetical protein PLE99_08465 [Candidatus Thiothrix moscowensis]|uniref:hypothetical protein n=1 Tax=unclassified Thiothrix TaxID=2636184 RepID=UPI001A1F6394|nr:MULTISPECIES: hypothetical protein [unclassified Thiothrix]MBJ6610331.1 hypothetical protein [Candidatus Thiothrix moscowensis]HRJ52788.1 hypothetical protein [Candidatus Thiothrix moscowensis]HRJ94443.1 hypothetical protein [Candidatus Thiothrix moscowensis]